MAKKVILMKLLQEMRGYENVTNRRPTPAAPLLYLMQLRQRNAQGQVPNPPTQARVAITASWQNATELPAPIEIHHGALPLPLLLS